MGVLDRIGSLLLRIEPGSSDTGPRKLGEVARTYVETGEAPNESWAAREGTNGEVHVVVTVQAEDGEFPEREDIEAVGTDIGALGGEVSHAEETGVLLAQIRKSRLGDLAEYDRIRQIEVTRGPGRG